MRYFDLHCDTISECYLKKCGLAKNKLHISCDKAENYETWVQVFAVWMPDEIRGVQAWERFKNICRTFQKETAENGIPACGNSEELENAVSSKNKIGSILSIEGSAALGGNLDNLSKAYNLGVRIITLTWNNACEAGGGCLDGGGLTDFGFELVTRMRELGMIVDVSHLSDQGFDDVASHTDSSFIASHSNSRAVCDNPRNLTDEQFKEIVSRKGIVGLNFYPNFIGGNSIELVLRHVDHFLNIGGENVLAMGVDFDGAQMPKEIKGIQDMTRFYTILSNSFGEDMAKRIFFDNAYEFFKTALTGCKSCNNIIKG